MGRKTRSFLGLYPQLLKKGVIFSFISLYLHTVSHSLSVCHQASPADHVPTAERACCGGMHWHHGCQSAKPVVVCESAQQTR